MSDSAEKDARCSCGNRFDGDNLCMVSACQWEGLEDQRPSVENDAPESPFGPLDASGHDGHAAQLNGLLADCPGCVTPPEESVPEMLARVAAEEEAHADDTDRPHYRNRVTPPEGGDRGEE